jgi:hypothetical protein
MRMRIDHSGPGLVPRRNAIVCRNLLLRRRCAVLLLSGPQFVRPAVLTLPYQVRPQDAAERHPHFKAPEPDDRSVPDLESVLRERLQKIAGDGEMQDLARSLLRQLTSTSGIGRPSAAASSPEVGTSICILFQRLFTDHIFADKYDPNP